MIDMQIIGAIIYMRIFGAIILIVLLQVAEIMADAWEDW